MEGPTEVEMSLPYISDSKQYMLVPMMSKYHRYGTLIFKDIKSGPYKKLETIPITVPEIQSNGFGRFTDEILNTYKLTQIEFHETHKNLFLIVPVFSEYDKPVADSYFALDSEGNYHKPIEVTVRSTSQTLVFDFPLKNLKALVPYIQDSGTITFKNISLVPGQMSEVKIDITFEPAEGEAIDLD